MTEEPLRVLIADDHPVFRDGLRGVLDTMGTAEVVAEAATSTAAGSGGSSSAASTWTWSGASGAVAKVAACWRSAPTRPSSSRAGGRRA